MKSKYVCSSFAVLLTSILCVAAAPKDEVIAAAKKLSESSYSWKSSADFGQFTREVTGKVDAEGTAVVNVPRRDDSMKAVIKGDKRVVETQDGWQALEDLEGGEGRGRFFARTVENLKTPVQEIQDMLKNAGELTMADGAYSAKLTPEGASQLLAFRRGGDGPSDAGGSIKVWVKNGVLSKYEYSVQGTVSFGGQDRDVDRTTTVEISNIGSTTVEVPAGAKEKLS